LPLKSGENALDNDQKSLTCRKCIKGKGVSFMEDAFAWHAKPPTDEHRDQALAELAALMAGRSGEMAR